MTDLPEFLLARIAEDEQIARTAADYDSDSEGGHWFADGGSIGPGKTPGWYQFEYVGAEHAEHMAHWDPARALAECDAKRRIVERYQRAEAAVEADERRVQAGGYSDERGAVGGWDVSALRPVLQLLALPYANHPDYREEWRP